MNKVSLEIQKAGLLLVKDVKGHLLKLTLTQMHYWEKKFHYFYALKTDFRDIVKYTRNRLNNLEMQTRKLDHHYFQQDLVSYLKYF